MHKSKPLQNCKPNKGYINFEEEGKVGYTKSQLENTCKLILGSDAVSALGLPRAIEECAIQLFLNLDADPVATQVVREAVSDIRNFGSFKFHDN